MHATILRVVALSIAFVVSSGGNGRRGHVLRGLRRGHLPRSLAALDARGSASIKRERLRNGFVPVKGEVVDCKLSSDQPNKGLMLLTSNGMTDSHLKYSFRELVLRLPDSAWPVDGGKTKAAARGRDLPLLAEAGFSEPELYKGLDVVMLEDACFLKDSMWNTANTFFNYSAKGGINYQTAGYTTNPSLVQPYLSAGGPLDGGWCVDLASSLFGGLGSSGFEASRLRHWSLFDRLASDSLKNQVLKLQTGRTVSGGLEIADTQSQAFNESRDLLRSADVLVFNGGNPDFLSYVLTSFAKPLGDLIRERVQAGSLVIAGRSAGAMVPAADWGLSYQEAPAILQVLNKGSTRGMGLVGKCAIRPHFKSEWMMASLVYEEMKSLKVVLMPDDEALQCIGLNCRMTGATSAQAPRPNFTLPENIERLASAFRSPRGK